MKPKYIVFDLNGTLIVGHYPSYSETLEKKLGLKRRKDETFSDEMLRKAATGKPPFKELVTKLYEIDEAGAITEAAFRLHASHVWLKRNALKVLRMLGTKYTLILCSDTIGVAKLVVKEFDLEKYFAKMLYSCDVGYLKSEKEFWVKCLDSLPGSRPSEFLVVGDNPRADTYWPRRLGMHTIKISSGISASQNYVEKPRGTLEEEPDHSIEDLEEILDLIALY
jgi:FMN phosphatase YigB (HAD superfamily)